MGHGHIEQVSGALMDLDYDWVNKAVQTSEKCDILKYSRQIPAASRKRQNSPVS